MKKKITIFLLLILICSILCGCTPDSEDQKTGTAASLPVLQPEGEQAIRTEPGNAASDPEQPNAAPSDQQAEVSTDKFTPETNGTNSETGETETEFVSEYVVDGVGGFGEGGN